MKTQSNYKNLNKKFKLFSSNFLFILLRSNERRK